MGPWVAVMVEHPVGFEPGFGIERWPGIVLQLGWGSRKVAPQQIDQVLMESHFHLSFT